MGGVCRPTAVAAFICPASLRGAAKFDTVPRPTKCPQVADLTPSPVGDGKASFNAFCATFCI